MEYDVPVPDLREPLMGMFRRDQRRDLTVEAGTPALDDLSGGQGGFREKAAHARHGRFGHDVAQQARERFRFVAEQQRQLNDLEVPVLRLAETATERCREVA